MAAAFPSFDAARPAYRAYRMTRMIFRQPGCGPGADVFYFAAEITDDVLIGENSERSGGDDTPELGIRTGTTTHQRYRGRRWPPGLPRHGNHHRRSPRRRSPAAGSGGEDPVLRSASHLERGPGFPFTCALGQPGDRSARRTCSGPMPDQQLQPELGQAGQRLRSSSAAHGHADGGALPPARPPPPPRDAYARPRRWQRPHPR